MRGTGTVSTRMSLMPRYTTARICDGIADALSRRAPEIWVAMSKSIHSWPTKICEQGIPKCLGSLAAILRHPHERGPVPWAEKRKKEKPRQPELPVRREKWVEVRQMDCVAIADCFDAGERNSTHSRQPGHSGSLHIYQASRISGRQAALLLGGGHPGVSYYPWPHHWLCVRRVLKGHSFSRAANLPHFRVGLSP